MPADTVASLREKGYFLLPLPARQKEPPPKGWVTRTQPYEIRDGDNLAIGLRGDVAVLITNDDQATAWAATNFGDPNVRSVRGAHWYFRAREDQANERDLATPVGRIEFHVRSKYAVVPPSVHPSGSSYTWVRPLPPVSELPEAPDVRELWHPKGGHHGKLLSMSFAAASSGRDAAEILSDLKSWRDRHLPDPHAHPDRELLQLAESAARKFRRPGASGSDSSSEDDGPQLFKDLTDRIRRHYYFDEEWHYTICALFVMQAWVVRAGALPAVFYLWFGGAFSSGKSNVLSLVSSLTDGLMLENVSPSALARVMESARTVLLDEVDVQRGEELDDVMASLLRSGYRRNGPPYVRWNAKEKAPEILPIFGPKCGTFRSALDPALQSRGFVIPTAKPIGEAHYELVLANLWPSTGEIIPRLRAWGKRAASVWSSEALEALSRTDPFQKRVRVVAGELGANRESELLTIALLVAQMVPVDVTGSLSSAKELRAVEISEDQAEAIDELRDGVLDVMSPVVTFSGDGREIYRVVQKTVRDRLNLRRRERQEKSVTTSRLALLRRELGVKDTWLAAHGHALVWNLPKAFVEELRAQSGRPAPAGPPELTHTPGNGSHSPPNLPSYSQPPIVLPSPGGSDPNVSGDGAAREHGSTMGVPQGDAQDFGSSSTGAGQRLPRVTDGLRPEESNLGTPTRVDRARRAWTSAHPGDAASSSGSAADGRIEYANRACEDCPDCRPPHEAPGDCTCQRCSPWGQQAGSTSATKPPHHCGPVSRRVRW
ncbi:MAG TPA: bifunctional DNA primase/polymerase [Thermoplasmata archaeon]|nr:bifunctional DNA primase/polymerase [Thermoplasmata archaeon]